MTDRDRVTIMVGKKGIANICFKENETKDFSPLIFIRNKEYLKILQNLPIMTPSNNKFIKRPRLQTTK